MNSTTCSGLMKRLLEISIKRIEEVFQTPPNNSSKSSGGKGVVIEQQLQLHCLLGPLELRPSPGRERWRQTFVTAWQALLTAEAHRLALRMVTPRFADRRSADILQRMLRLLLYYPLLGAVALAADYY